jgi:hypothetical protein
VASDDDRAGRRAALPGPAGGAGRESPAMNPSEPALERLAYCLAAAASAYDPALLTTWERTHAAHVPETGPADAPEPPERRS